MATVVMPYERGTLVGVTSAGDDIAIELNGQVAYARRRSTHNAGVGAELKVVTG